MIVGRFHFSLFRLPLLSPFFSSSFFEFSYPGKQVAPSKHGFAFSPSVPFLIAPKLFLRIPPCPLTIYLPSNPLDPLFNFLTYGPQETPISRRLIEIRPTKVQLSPTFFFPAYLRTCAGHRDGFVRISPPF